MLGHFITFEGLDGTGKSTQLNLLADSLRAAGYEVITTREPGGTPVGDKIRALLLDSRSTGIAPLAELAMMFSSRAQLIHDVIRPAIAGGAWVLCDRYTDSSEAYQGYGRRLGLEPIRELHHTLCGDLQPEITFLMVGDLNAVLDRARKRNSRTTAAGGANEGRFEKENRAFYQRVHEGYEALAARETGRVVKVDARQSISTIQKQIAAIVRDRLGAKLI